MNLEADFRDFVQLLNEHQVEYMVIGGYALAFHGEPRFTGDLDIWIDCTETNAGKMVDALRDFGASSLGFTIADFLDGRIIKQIGQPPLRIDILGEIDGLRYKDAVKNKQHFKSGGLEIPFIGVKDFIRNKEAVGRNKDLADAKKLGNKQGKRKVKRPVSRKKKK